MHPTLQLSESHSKNKRSDCVVAYPKKVESAVLERSMSDVIHTFLDNDGSHLRRDINLNRWGHFRIKEAACDGEHLIQDM